MGWPHKIEQQMEQTETQLEEDIVLYCIVFYFRWTAVGWPHKIEQQMEQTETQLEEDIVLYCIVLYCILLQVDSGGVAAQDKSNRWNRLRLN